MHRITLQHNGMYMYSARGIYITHRHMRKSCIQTFLLAHNKDKRTTTSFSATEPSRQLNTIGLRSTHTNQLQNPCCIYTPRVNDLASTFHLSPISLPTSVSMHSHVSTKSRSNSHRVYQSTCDPISKHNP